MIKINLTGIPIEKVTSPRGQYRCLTQDICRALSGLNGLGKAGLIQPFNVELIRLPPGAVNWPYHSHSAVWELYLVLSGRGHVRTPEGFTDLREGDCLLHPPGEPHQIVNKGAIDLVYYVIANNTPSDVCHFPDTNKWLLPGEENPVRVLPSSFYEGEE